MRDERLERVSELFEAVRPQFVGEKPEIVGAVLVELTALWLAGHAPAEIREPLLSAHIRAIWKLHRVYAEQLHGENGSTEKH